MSRLCHSDVASREARRTACSRAGSDALAPVWPIRWKRTAPAGRASRTSKSLIVRILSGCQFSGDQRDVHRTKSLRREQLQTHVIDHLYGETRVENMLMQTPVFEIVSGALPEGLQISSAVIHAQVMKAQDLIEMGQVVLLHLRIKILDQVRQ